MPIWEKDMRNNWVKTFICLFLVGIGVVACDTADNQMPVPDFGQYVFCWDRDADGDPATLASTCEQETNQYCVYWSPSIWKAGVGNSLPDCGMFGPSCAKKRPTAIECALTDQPDFSSLPVSERHVITSRTIDRPRFN